MKEQEVSFPAPILNRVEKANIEQVMLSVIGTKTGVSRYCVVPIYGKSREADFFIITITKGCHSTALGRLCALSTSY